MKKETATSTESTESKELITTISTDVFKQENSIEAIIVEIENQCKDMVFDVSTLQGRKDCKALCTKITASKTLIEKSGAQLAKEVKALPKIIDANRKLSKDRLDALKKHVRAGLTAWEDEQKAIKEAKAKAELQKQIDADHEVALILYNEHLRLIEEEKQAQAKLQAEQEEKRIADRLTEQQAQQKRDLELAELRQKQAEQEAEQLRKDAEMLRAKAEQEAIEREKQQAEREKQQAEQQLQQQAYANNQYVDFSITHMKNALFSIANAKSEAELDAIAKDAVMHTKFNFDLGDRLQEVEDAKNAMINAGKARRAELVEIAKQELVHIVFPDGETTKLIMNDIIDAVINRGFEFEKQGTDTLVVKKKVVVASNEWGLK